MSDYTTACLDWEERLVDGRSILPEPLFPEEADAALAVFKSLKMVDAPKVEDPETGQLRYQTMGEVGADWLFELVRAIFGGYNAETGKQLIQEAFLLISKKNGKSTDAAAIMLTALILNWRDHQELMILAPTLEVANNAFIPAKGMVEADDDLITVMHIQDHLKTITHLNTKAVLKVVAADSGTVSGSKAGFVLVDELWLFGQRADADAMLQEATGGLVSRPEGFVIWASTQSDKEPAGVFKTKLQYFRDVRDGVVFDPSSLPVLYEFPEAMIEAKEYLNPKNFYITNPNIGRSVSVEWLQAKLAKVINAVGGELQVFLAKHLNIEIGLRLSHDRWRGADYWEECAEPCLTLDDLLARSEVVVAGIDGGGLDDLFGFCAVGREKVTRKWLLWVHAIVHPKILKLRADIAPELLECEKEGSLTFCEVGDDMILIGDFMKRLIDSELLPKQKAVGFDPNNIASVIETLISVGVTDEMLQRLLQGPALSPAINMIPRKLLEHTFAHGGTRLMNWCVGNSKVERRGNGIMITKQIAGTAKIDPVIALLCGATLMSWNPTAFAKRSVYEDRGIRTL